MNGNLADILPHVREEWPAPSNDPVRRTGLLQLSLVFQILSTCMVSARLYLRARKQAGSLGLDDACVFIAWLFSVCFTTTVWISIQRYHMDRHTWDVRSELIPGAIYVAWLAQIFLLLSTCGTKIAILLFYRPIVAASRKLTIAIWVALALTVVYLLGIFLTYCLLCQPLESYWRSYEYGYDKPYHCADAPSLNLIKGVFSVVSDVCFAFLPWMLVTHYNMPTNSGQKIRMYVPLALGLVVAVAGGFRVYHSVRLSVTQDIFWTAFDFYIWSIVECTTYLVCASIPTLLVFLKSYPFKFIKSSNNTSSRSDTLRQDMPQDDGKSFYELTSATGSSSGPPNQQDKSVDSV